MIFLITTDRKMILNIDGNFVILTPIVSRLAIQNISLNEYYKKLFGLVTESLDGFIRSRIKIVNNRIIIDYYDAIDQFFYVIKSIIKSADLFELKNFNAQDYLHELLEYIIRYITKSELKNLRSAIECSSDHPMNSFRSLSLVTFRLFNKLAHNGKLDYLNQNDIVQLCDAFTFDNVFDNMPLFIGLMYKKLSKAIPFKILEKILKKQKIIDYNL